MINVFSADFVFSCFLVLLLQLSWFDILGALDAFNQHMFLAAPVTLFTLTSNL